MNAAKARTVAQRSISITSLLMERLLWQSVAVCGADVAYGTDMTLICVRSAKEHADESVAVMQG